MSGRERLPDRRQAIHCLISWEPRPGQEAEAIEVGVGLFDDGRLAEVFTTARKSEFDAMLSDAAILISYLLQLGYPPLLISGAVGRQDGANGGVAGRAMTPIGAICDLLCDLDAERHAALQAPDRVLAGPATAQLHEVLAVAASRRAAP